MTEYTCQFCDGLFDADKMHWIYGDIHGIQHTDYVKRICDRCYFAFATGYKTGLDQIESKIHEINEINPMPTYEEGE